MLSKGVLDRQKVAKALLASARCHARQVGEGLQTSLAAVVEDGETLPDRETETTQLRKDAAFEAFDDVARGVADTLRGWCHLAGLPEFADGTRLTLPSRRRAA